MSENSPETQKNSSASFKKASFFLTAFIAFVLAGFVLKVTAQVFVLFTISVFLACVMHPMVKGLERLKINRFISIILAVCIMIAGLSLIGIVLFSSGRTILSRYPLYEKRLLEVYQWIGRFFELPYDKDLGLVENLWAQLGIRNNIRQLMFSFSNNFIGF